MRWLHFTVLAATLAACTSLPPDTGQLPKISWECDGKPDAHGEILQSLSLRVDDRVILLTEQTAICRELKRSEYHRHDVPETAITAAAGWLAGAGDEFYVAVDGSFLVIFHRTVDSQAEIPSYRVLQRIPLRRTTSTPADAAPP